jgi:hypothetical protein
MGGPRVNLLCCCSGCQTSYEVPRFINTTVVDNYTAGPDTIAPYSRPWKFLSSGDCVLEDCDIPDEPVCASRGFDGSTNLYDGITPGGEATINYNGYEESGTTTVNNLCYGWKGVMARKLWHGTRGFIESKCCPDGSGQSQVKYTTRTEVVSAHFHYDITFTAWCEGQDPPFLSQTIDYIVEVTLNSAVDNYGNKTGSMTVSVTDITTENGSTVSEFESCLIDDIEGTSGTVVAFTDGIIPAGVSVFGAECGDISFTYKESSAAVPVVLAGTAEDLTTAAHFGPLSGSTQGACGSGTSGGTTNIDIDPESHAAEWSCTDTELSVIWHSACEFSGVKCCDDFPNPGESARDYTGSAFLTYSHTVTLGGGVNYSSIKDQAKALLSEWSLVDDAAYPWRQDAMTWLVPLVTVDEAREPVTPDFTFSQDEETCAAIVPAAQYTGEVRGAPNPAGYDRHFNFDHINWIAGTNTGGTVCTACEGSIGMLSATPLPATATQWTDKGTTQGPNTHGPCAWISNRITGQYGITGSLPDQIEDGVRMYKWAETVESWPALNYSRPCGRDRYLFDETAIACIENFDGTNLEIEEIPLSGPTEFSVSDIIAINTGVYQVATKTDAQNYTVGSKLYDLLIPCDGASKLRFPSVRGICGELDVVSATQDGGNVIIVTDGKHWLKRNGTSNDTVNFSGVAGLGSGLTATVTDDTTFTVPGTLSGAYTSGGMVSQTGANVTWDTTCPRKSYFTREWQSRYREYDIEDPEDVPYTVTETQRGYSSTSPTKPYIVCISPNAGDTPTNGVRYSFGDIDHDQCWGEEWAMDVVQALNDPYWQEPHVACAHSGEWAMDSAPCSGDGDYEYPPLVEARLTPPTGAPTETVPLYVAESVGIPGAVGHPNCSIEPYARGPVHTIRAAWEVCDTWPEKTMHRCDSFPFPTEP